MDASIAFALPSARSSIEAAAELRGRTPELSEIRSRHSISLDCKHIYDTTKFGQGNGGREFGDHLTPTGHHAVIEYLKTL